MNLAKVSANGQVTVPVEVRRHLRISPGDKLLFVEKDNGEIVLVNAAETALNALTKAQAAFAGASNDFGARNEDEVNDLVNELRVERAGS